MPRVRIHQHVNPLAPFYTRAPEPLDIKAIFADPRLPLHLDIGSARGRFLLRMAMADPKQNFLGVEIREPLVEEANRIAQENGLGNLSYAFCNAMLNLGVLLGDLPPGRLRSVSIQFPDPWFKKKHAKRRMVNPELVETLVHHLDTGGKIFVQTDIEFLADEMFEIFARSADLRLIQVADSPYPVKTEREKAVEDKGLPIYRALFEKSRPAPERV
jgi:tRNA (guanine-N7-)-methyltransferase